MFPGRTFAQACKRCGLVGVTLTLWGSTMFQTYRAMRNSWTSFIPNFQACSSLFPCDLLSTIRRLFSIRLRMSRRRQTRLVSAQLAYRRAVNMCLFIPRKHHSLQALGTTGQSLRNGRPPSVSPMTMHQSEQEKSIGKPAQYYWASIKRQDL